MDIKPDFYKTFQFRLNNYCIIKKPYLSIDTKINKNIKSTMFVFFTHFDQIQKSDKWNKHFSILLSNYKYPIVLVSIIPINSFSFNIYDVRYSLSLSPNEYSFFYEFIQDYPIKYGISYIHKPIPSFIGSIYINNIIFLSANFQEKYFSLFSKIYVDYQYFFFFGLNLVDKKTFFNSNISEIDVGVQVPIFNGLFTFGYGITEPFGISTSFIKNNHRFTFTHRSAFNRQRNQFQNDDYFQYKYVQNKRKKLGILYDFSQKTFHLRGSLHVFDNFKIKSSVKYNGHFCEPTFGFSIDF